MYDNVTILGVFYISILEGLSEVESCVHNPHLKVYPIPWNMCSLTHDLSRPVLIEGDSVDVFQCAMTIGEYEQDNRVGHCHVGSVPANMAVLPGTDI